MRASVPESESDNRTRLVISQENGIVGEEMLSR